MREKSRQSAKGFSNTVNPGFNGQLHEPAAGWQILGNGYRVYNPVLMRFHSPDSLSPFARSGLNAYGYCQADPANGADPSGHAPIRPGARSRQIIGHTLKNRLVDEVFVLKAGEPDSPWLSADPSLIKDLKAILAYREIRLAIAERQVSKRLRSGQWPDATLNRRINKAAQKRGFALLAMNAAEQSAAPLQLTAHSRQLLRQEAQRVGPPPFEVIANPQRYPGFRLHLHRAGRVTGEKPASRINRDVRGTDT